jgi:[ribosomal protein S18]-alanine N-acetyltransferase
MSLDDLDQILEIDRESFSLPWPPSAYRYEIMDNEASLCRVVELVSSLNTRKIVGLLVIWIILDEAHIATIATHPEYRQYGIARKILAEGLRDSMLRGARLATLEVRESNLPAQKLYEQFKFEIVGRRAHYYRDNQEDALLMTVHNLDAQYHAWLEQVISER